MQVPFFEANGVPGGGTLTPSAWRKNAQVQLIHKWSHQHTQVSGPARLGLQEGTACLRGRVFKTDRCLSYQCWVPHTDRGVVQWPTFGPVPGTPFSVK